MERTKTIPFGGGWADVYYSGFSRETKSIEYRYRYMQRFIIRHLLKQLWRAISPTIWCLQAGNPGKPMVVLKGLRAREPMVEIPVWVWRPENYKCWGEVKIDVSAHGFRQRANATFFCIFVLFSCSTDWWRPPPTFGKIIVLLCLPIQMLISFRNTPQTQAKIIFNQLSSGSWPSQADI